MPRKTFQAPVCAAVAAALALAPSSGSAVIPALLAHQIIKQIVEGELRQHVASMFAGSGCKGSAIGGLLSSVGMVPGGAGLPGAAGLGGLGGLAGGGLASLAGAAPGKGAGAVLGNLALPHLVGRLFSGTHTSKPSPTGATPPAAGPSPEASGEAGAAATATGPATPPAPAAPSAAVPAAVSAGVLAPLTSFGSPEAVGLAQGAALAASPGTSQVMSALGSARGHPLSPAETLEVFGELKDMGLMDPQQLREVQECLDAGGAQAAQTLGTGAAFMTTSVLPPLRQVKEQFAHLTPEEENQLATEIAEQLRQAPPEPRKRFLEGYGAGLFPPTVLQQARAKLGAP